MGARLELVVSVALMGIGATVTMDLWSAFLKCIFGLPALNYGLVGRWLGHLPRARFAHQNIAKAPPVRGEVVIGWFAHYAIGIVFAGLLLAIWGLDWARNPTPLPALIVGLVTLAAPFFVMQPCMGAGIAAAKAPSPNAARLRSVLAHLAFGIGLYGSALLWALLVRV